SDDWLLSSLCGPDHLVEGASIDRVLNQGPLNSRERPPLRRCDRGVWVEILTQYRRKLTWGYSIKVLQVVVWPNTHKIGQIEFPRLQRCRPMRIVVSQRLIQISKAAA